MTTGAVSNFKSYVSEAEKDSKINEKLKKAMSKIRKSPDEMLEGKLLHGEVSIGYANKVIKYNVHDDPTRGISGTLVCTNFRVIFLTAEKVSYDLIELKNRMLDEHDIVLSNIESIFVEYPNKRKRLVPSSKVKDGIQRLELHCKDFRVAAFNFKLTVKGEEKVVIKPILHYSYPQVVNRMFAFDYKHGKSVSEVCKIPLYRTTTDWEKELERCGAKCWRPTVANRKFVESPTMPAYFVVPASIKDNELLEASKQFNDSRVPMWCWSDSKGCSLVRMAMVRSDSEHQVSEEKMLSAIKSADVSNRPLKVFNLTKLCPSCNQLQQSFNKLKSLCMPSNLHDFWDSDREWLTVLHSSKWMQHISTLLSVAKNAASALHDKNYNVVIQESSGVDITPVVTSLVQLMLDSSSRTLNGLQALIQKEWVAAGHPFLDRIGHLLQPKRKKPKQMTSVTEDGETAELAPVFLLFLDCVYQMMVQYPACFEASVTFLTVLYDATQMTVFDTFLFNNERQRHKKICENELADQPFAMQQIDAVPKTQLLPIWAWEIQYTKLDMALFNNPLYKMRTMPNYSKYVEESAGAVLSTSKPVLSRISSSESDDRNGDLPDGVTSFSKEPFKSPSKNPFARAKKKQSLKETDGEEYKNKSEHFQKVKGKTRSLERTEETDSGRGYKATAGGHYPKVALMPKNSLYKQTSEVTQRQIAPEVTEERMSRSKSYTEHLSEDDEQDESSKAEENDVFMPLAEFTSSKPSESEVKLKHRFSLRRKKSKENNDDENIMQRKPKERYIRMQDPTVQPRSQQHSGTEHPLYPATSVSRLKVWRQCYFRWLQWSQIYGGGPASMLQQESLLYDDIHILQNKVQMLERQLKDESPNFHDTYLSHELGSPSGMYFHHSSEFLENDTVFDGDLGRSSSQTSLNVISSYFPYSPITCLRSKSILGTPMSDFLQGGSIFNFGKNRGKHSRTPSGISITRSLAQSVEDLAGVNMSALSRSLEDVTAESTNDPNLRDRKHSDVMPRKRLHNVDIDKKPKKVHPPPVSRAPVERITYETSL